MTDLTAIEGMTAGFKIVTFDAMYNQDGLMPWIMHGVHIPSIGIVGRWSDRTHALGGVEGPYILWRDRVQDLRDQEAEQKEYERQRELGKDVSAPTILPTRYLKRTTRDLAFIIREELSRVSP